MSEQESVSFGPMNQAGLGYHIAETYGFKQKHAITLASWLSEFMRTNKRGSDAQFDFTREDILDLFACERYLWPFDLRKAWSEFLPEKDTTYTLQEFFASPEFAPYRETIFQKFRAETGRDGNGGLFNLRDVLEKDDEEIHPVELSPIVRKDDDEPVYIVRNGNDANAVRENILAPRLKTGEIDKYYFERAIQILNDESRRLFIEQSERKAGVPETELGCEVILADKNTDVDLRRACEKRLSFYDLIAFLKSRPVLLTWRDAVLERVLSENAVNFSVTAKMPSSWEQVKALVKVYAPTQSQATPDMPVSILTGRLGEMCQQYLGDLPLAYAYPALLTVAGSMLLTEREGIRTNLYCALTGKIGSGKSQAMDRALALFNAGEPIVVETRAGSAEGLFATPELQSARGGPRLLHLDELGHLLIKANIEGASFPYVLTELFYKSRFTGIAAKKQNFNANCRFSILGGIVENQFSDLFGAGTVGGLHDRFIFGRGPDDFIYNYEPFEHSGAGVESIPGVVPKIDRDVWRAKNAYRKEHPDANDRLVEIALRVAFIAAAYDGKESLTVKDLDTAWQFVAWQEAARKVLVPSAGLTLDARLAEKIVAVLGEHPAQWFNLREVLRKIHAERFGPKIVEGTVASLLRQNVLESLRQDSGQKGGRPAMFIRLPAEA